MGYTACTRQLSSAQTALGRAHLCLSAVFHRAETSLVISVSLAPGSLACSAGYCSFMKSPYALTGPAFSFGTRGALHTGTDVSLVPSVGPGQLAAPRSTLAQSQGGLTWELWRAFQPWGAPGRRLPWPGRRCPRSCSSIRSVSGASHLGQDLVISSQPHAPCSAIELKSSAAAEFRQTDKPDPDSTRMLFACC